MARWVRLRSPAYFYPRPPRGGRPVIFIVHPPFGQFLSTPSARRATPDRSARCWRYPISIHALREEGDSMRPPTFKRLLDFYPRPPRGGRLGRIWTASFTTRFLSTPSARRATFSLFTSVTLPRHFYPRPPRGGRPEHRGRNRGGRDISIHALREEGDPSDFYPYVRLYISIHALREEGDPVCGPVH